MILHGYFRSTSSWRVRIVLALKGITVEQRAHHLRRGEHQRPDFLALNPQGQLPVLELDDGTVLTQSLAIAEYLDDLHPEPPLLPAAPVARAHARAIAQLIACDIHPVQNLRVLTRLRAMGHGDAEVKGWAADVIREGLDACETLLGRYEGPYCFGASPTLADAALIPQLANARRFGAEGDWPRIHAITALCADHPAFIAADASAQPDAE
ncbi:maleylacetoacetate isomerase [Sphingomonas sp. QA11]|uniref:maleylacetoacetate isomerase n=1 Tax=Sphingomonas sp. QA11 TaxID=2950605 RepID=UPI00234BACC0|nr:maleylacetoacetate isomerase [Sphingomonas sp. QA11]WCM28595.1 maleylacetoacetate isomerase [Sphingomonas sp. QA11]